VKERRKSKDEGEDAEMKERRSGGEEKMKK
jgi:hypothetical protein